MGVFTLQARKYFSRSFFEGPSEPERVGSGGIATRRALIGSLGKPRNRSTSWFVWKDSKAAGKLRNFGANGD